MYNKKILLDALKKLDKAKAPAKKKDTMFDPTGKGMLNPNYAGKPVVLPTDTLYNPTPYTIKATSDNGIQKFLNPFDETPVHFPGASSIKEEPIMRKGGTKKFSKSLAATNKLMKKNPLLKKKSYKGKTYDPSAMYFQDGGTFEELELTDEEIEEYKKGGYVVEYVDDPSIPELTKAQNGLFLAANAAITSTPATKNTILAAGKGPVPITPVNPPTAKPVSFVPGVEYRYADRPDSSYKIGPNGQILIKNPDTGGQYVPIDDPGGSRRQTLLKGFQTGKTVPIAPPKASKELINKTRVVEPIPTPAPVPQTPPVIETWEPPAEPVMAPVIETAVSTPVSKSSEPKVRYHVEYNPYTRKYEPMSFRQRAELMSLYNRGLPMPENWQPELLDERTRQPIKKQTGGQKPTVYVDPNDPAGRARYQAYQDSLKTYSTNDFLFKDVKQQLGKNFDKFDVINLTVPQLKSIFSHDPNIIKEYFGRGNDPVKGINVKVKPQYYNQRYNNNQFLEYIFPVFAKPTQPVEYKPDPKIVAKQQQLIDAGYKIGKADGIWGPKSQTAWEEFQKTQPVQTNQPQVTPVPQIPSGYNVWTDHLGQPLDPQIYGYAPSNNPRQISQHADTYALKRANEFYTKIGATPWATTGNKLLTDPSKPYFSKQAATNALEQTAQQIGVEVSQLQVIKAPAGYPGYVIIQTLPQQRYGGSFQIGGQLSSEEFAKRKAAYEKVTGRKLEQPKTFKPSEKARQATLDKYNQLPMVQSQPSETVDQSRGIDTRREKEIVEAQANTDAKAAENYMHFYNKTYGSDYGAITYEQALQKVRLPNFDKAKYLNMYNLGESKNEQLQSFRKEDQANRTWEVITNPFTAFEYAVTTGDMANMPSNINAARMQGYDVGATPGRNMVGNALNMTTNLFDAGDKVVRNIGEGNLLGAGMEALRFLPGARLSTGLTNKIPTSVYTLPRAKTFKEAIGTFGGIPTEKSLARLSNEELKIYRQAQEIGRMRATGRPVSEQYRYALNQNIPEEHLQQIFGKSSDEIQSGIIDALEREAYILETPITERFNLERPARRRRRGSDSDLTLNSSDSDITRSDVVRGALEDFNFDLTLPDDFFYDANAFMNQVLELRPRPNAIERVSEKTDNILKTTKNKILDAAQNYPVHKGHVIQNVPSLSLSGSGTLKKVSDKVANDAVYNINSGDVFTGSLNTSHSSYLPQLKQVFKYKDGSPQFLGYQPMNDLGFLSGFNYSPKDIAKYLNAEIDLQIKRGILPSNIQRPFIQKNSVLLPHYGIKQFQQGGQLSPEEFEKRKAAYEKLTGKKFTSRDIDKIKQQQNLQKFIDDKKPLEKRLPTSESEAWAMIDSGEIDLKTYGEIKELAKEEARAREEERRRSLESYEARVNTPGYSAWTGLPGESWRDMLAAEAAPLAAQFRVSQGDNFFDDYINPAVWIGSMAQSLGEAPQQAKETGSLLPYATALGIPLLGGAMAGIGANNTRQFVNNIVNPFAGMNPLKFKQLPGSPNAISSVDDVGRDLRNIYDPTPRINRTPLDYSEKPLLSRDMEPYIGRRTLKSNKDQDIFESFLSGENLKKQRDARVINYTQAEAQALEDASKGLTNIPEPWQMQELPGLHLKSTMEGEAISKIIEPKTGLINTEQALAIIGKESGGADKVALIRQGLGDNIPKKMDYNEFRKVVQDQLIPLERQLSKKTSWYGINRIGYGDPTDIIVNAENKRITPVQPLENQTLILSNKSKFGRGSSAHSNPEETLGHMHFLRDPETPDVLTVTQIQSDAFQGTHRIMPKSKENLLKDIETGWATNEGIENFTQKQLLDKNHQERYLQELVDYAAKRGDINKIRIPTSETAAKVQGYSKEQINTNVDYINPLPADATKAQKKAFEQYTDDLRNNRKADYIKEDYLPEHKTILKKYSEQPKTIKKLFGKEPTIVTDSNGNTWYEFDIPKKFKEGKGEIKAFGLAPFIGIGAAGALGATSEFQQGGQIQEKAIELELTPEEIEWYKSQGYVVEDLPNAQVGGTPSEIWKQYTNTSWSEAKKQGLTDGSAKQNIELANRLLAGEFGEAKVSYEDYQNSRATYDKMVVDKVMRGATLDDLVSQKVGTRSGLINRFPDLFGTQTSTQSKTLPDKASAKKETDNKRSSAPAQEPVITPPVVKQPEQQEPLSLQELREKIKGLKKNTNVTSPTRLLQEYLSNPIKYRKELEEFQKANQPSLHPSLYMKESDFNSSPVAPVPLSRGNTPQPIPGGLGSQITNMGRPGFVNQDLLRFTEEERQRHEEEAKGRVKQYDAGVLGNLLNPAGQAFTSLDTHKGLDNLKKDFNDYTQYAKRFAVKEGLADVEEEKVVIKKQKPVKPLPAKNKIDSYYNEIATVADKYTKSDSLLSYRNQWDNSKGFEYIATPVKKDRDPNGVYKNVKGVAHFLLDASANPIKPYSHEFNKSFLQKAKDNNDWIPTFQTVDASSDRVRLVYKKPDELTDADNVYAPLRQMKFSEINFSNTKTPKGFKTGIKEVTKNDGEGTYLIFKNRDGYSRFSGGSVVFIFKDKSGNTIVRDFAGSLNQIEKEGLDIQKQYNIKSEDLTIGYHDVGSFSAKPKANSKGELKTSQWNGFNPEAWTGGALLIPND